MERIDLICGFLMTKFRLSSTKIKSILEVYEDVEVGFDVGFKDLGNEVWQLELKNNLDFENDLNSFRVSLNNEKVSVVSRFSPDFPKALLVLKQIPFVLFYQGDLSLCESENLLTVVGSRNYSRYSEMVMKKILEPVVANDIVIVSGLALGIDTIAHERALLVGQKTIAVIGSGLDEKVFFPQQNLVLKEKIISSGGLVLSEYPIGFEATRFSFPQRNRILAALSPVTWVVEAGAQSGSLITAREASNLGRRVVTTSASIVEDGFSGNIKLIEQGSKAITRAEDILDLYGIGVVEVKKNQELRPTDEKQLEIFGLLNREGIGVEEVSKKLALNPNTVLQSLSMMELLGFAKNLGSNIWAKP
jgi:DNA processing protein